MEIPYWRVMYADSYSSQQITMLATDDLEADLAKLTAAYPTAGLELWESDSLGDERHEDGIDMYRIHYRVPPFALGVRGPGAFWHVHVI